MMQTEIPPQSFLKRAGVWCEPVERTAYPLPSQPVRNRPQPALLAKEGRQLPKKGGTTGYPVPIFG